MSKYLIFLLCSSAFAGESIQLTAASVGNASVAAQTAGNNYRVEFSIHDWNSNMTAGTPFVINPVGLVVQFQNAGGGDIRLQMYNTTAAGPSYGVCQFKLGTLATSFVTVRYQEDGTNKIDYCQAWDVNGNLVNNTSSVYTTQTGSNSAGVTLGTTGQSLSLAYFRIYTSLVGLNARPPVTADTLSSCLVFWKFDQGNNTGSLSDSCSAGPYSATMSAGPPTYVATPGQGLVMSVLKNANAPVWGNWGTFRAGFPGQLDGTASYSQADASANVSCMWQLLSGPSQLVWDTHTSCTPTVQGLIFGDYQFQLAVTDINTVQATAIQDMGAVSMDSNGVVVNADPNIDFLFGPMIAFGRNPWGYEDYFALHASQLREADYLSQGWAPVPQWENPGQGTVSFYLNCAGMAYFCNNSLGSTLSGAAAVGVSSFTVASTSGLDLSAYPTHVILYDGGSSAEVRICSNAGTTLNVCYDGWGNSAAHTFASGQYVLQAKVSGSSTKFLTDSVAPVCPVGAPGPPGPSLYSTGGIALAAGSATVTGSGTTFASSMVGAYIRVPSTHGGVAFVFVAQITAFNSATSLTLNRVYPSDADSGSGLAYNIMTASRTIVLRYPHAVDSSGLGELIWATSGCESETAVYTNPLIQGNSFASGHDIPAVDGIHSVGNIYSVTDTTGWVNQSSLGGISFYGESLAHRVLYYRSGLSSALTAANYISDYWIKSPWGNADGNGTPRLFLGGEGIGSFVSAILTGRVAWSDLRGYAGLGVTMVNGIASSGCDSYDDTRDSGYAYAWLILAAIYDPDTTSTAAPGGIPWRTYWQNQLAQMQINDTNCQRSDNSFANGFYFNTSGPIVTMTNGSAAVTGSGLPSTLCNGIASGTATVANGTNVITAVSGSFPTGTDLFLTGTTGGGASVFVQSLAYGGTGASATLGGNWLGDSGTVSWVAGNFDGYAGDGEPQDMLTIAINNDDLTDLKKNWACTWNSATLITLNRAWDGASSDGSHVYHIYNQNLAGYGQQPFMLGIKSYGENLLATQTLPALSSYVAPYQTFTGNSTSWIWNNGMDQQLLGTNYGRVFQQCEPVNTAPSGTSFTFRAAGCTYGADPAALYLSREQNSETGAAHTIFYQNNASPANKTLGDEYYGALWGYCAWTTAGAFCDPNSTAANAGSSNLADNYVNAGKWTGFFTGVGMSHRWPAVRLGGVQPRQPRTVFVSVRTADIPAGGSIKVLVTAPSGAQSSFTCNSVPCAVSVDDRQGAHLYQIQYLSSSGSVLSHSQTSLLAIQ